MEWVSQDLKKLPRKSNFPLQVSSVYYCQNCIFPKAERTMSHFEVSLRLSRESAELCNDLVDNQPINMPWPHTIFKVPGMNTSIEDNHPRNTISFTYETKDCNLLREWNLIPEEKFWQITMDARLEELISQWRTLLRCYTSDGVIDQLDWVCFQILRELVFSRCKPLEEDSSGRIRKAALYLEQHYDRKINCDIIAGKFGFSHASFFRHWKMQFGISPQEYLKRYRLEISKRRLDYTELSVADIVREIHFSSIAAFHREFKKLYGQTPSQYRRSENSKK